MIGSLIATVLDIKITVYTKKRNCMPCLFISSTYICQTLIVRFGVLMFCFT